MKKKNSFGTKTVTMTAIFSALGVVFLYIGSIFDFLDLTAAMAASFIVIFAVIEGGGVVPWMIYAGTAIISLLLLPNKYPAVIYLFFAGLYPMVKSYSERLSIPVALIIKLLFTNAMLTVIILIAKYLLAVPDDELGLRVTVYIACNAMLIVFDYLLTQLITVYQKKLRRVFHSADIFR